MSITLRDPRQYAADVREHLRRQAAKTRRLLGDRPQLVLTRHQADGVAQLFDLVADLLDDLVVLAPDPATAPELQEVPGV